MIFVCNTGPLIALAKLDRLSLLQHLAAERVLIPPMVQRELWGKIDPEAAAIDDALNSFIHVTPPGKAGQSVEMAAASLDNGEREVIGLGASLQEETVLLMDDQAGRRVAWELGLSVLGTAGLLLLAKHKGAVEAVVPLLNALRRHGYWLSDALVAQVRVLAGE